MQRSEPIQFIFIFALAILLLPGAVRAQNAAPSPDGGPRDAVSYGFVIDNSGSFRKLLEDVIQFVRKVAEKNSPDDETFFVRFVNSDKIKLDQEFTPNVAEILDSAENMYVEAGQKTIIDAVRSSGVYFAENAKNEGGRLRSMILVSDGDEGLSISKVEDTLEILKKAKIRVIAVAVSDERVQTKVLDRLARETGGKLFVMKGPFQLRTAAEEVAAALRKP